MSDPIRTQLLEEIVSMMKHIRDMEDCCKFNHSLPLPTTGLEKFPHHEIVSAHRFMAEVVVPASKHVTTKWLMISEVIRPQMREAAFRDTLKLFKAHYDSYLMVLQGHEKPMLFNKEQALKVIKVALRKERAARDAMTPKEKKPPKVNILEGFQEACDVAKFQRQLKDAEHAKRKRRKSRNPSGGAGQVGGDNLPPADRGSSSPESGS